LESRLRRLGVQATPRFNATLSCCFVTNPHSLEFESLARHIPVGTRMVLLGGRQVFDRPGWTCLPSPVTQAALQTLLDDFAEGDARVRQVLVVDDSVANRQMLTRQLRELGQEVMQAETGEEALALDALPSCDLVFMDLQLPGISGLDTARQLRAMGLAMPIYGLTAHATEDETSLGIAAGMTDVLIKPMRLSRLQGLLRLPMAASKAPMAAAATRETPMFDPELALANADNNPSLAEELMAVFMDGLAEDQRLVNQSLGSKTALAAQIHRLHGAVRYCGLPRLQNVLTAIETALKEDDETLAASLVHLLNAEITALRSWHRKNPKLFSHFTSLP
ncbi:MAG: response regulator, partial [Pseudomonadales bacterium]